MKDILAEKVMKPQLEMIERALRDTPAGVGNPGMGPVTDPSPEETFNPSIRQGVLEEEYNRNGMNEQYETGNLDPMIDRRGGDI